MLMKARRLRRYLCESETRHRELANCLPEIVFETRHKWAIRICLMKGALKFLAILRVRFEKGLNILQFLVPEDREKATKRIQRLLAGGSYVPAEYTFMRKDGTTFPALITATPRVSKNKVTGLEGLSLDITERKKLEESCVKRE